METESKADVYLFGDFRLDRRTHILSGGSEPQTLAPKVAQLLLVLLDNAPNLVSREELRNELWSESTYIEFEGALNACVRQARAALGDTASAARYIETRPKRGYRFVAELNPDSPATETSFSGWKQVVMVVAVLLAGISLLMAGIDPPEPRRLVILLIETGPNVELDPIAAYGIAMLVSETLADKKPQQYSIINSRSIRNLASDALDLQSIESPDLIVKTVIHRQASVYSLQATLYDTVENRTLSTLSESETIDISTLTRSAPLKLTDWLSAALRIETRPQVNNVEAAEYDFDEMFVQAMWHLESGNPKDLPAAISKFDEILAARPEHIQALEGKLTALLELYFYTLPTQQNSDIFLRIEALGREITQKNTSSAYGYLALGFVQLFRDWNISGSINNIEAALLIDPNNAKSHGLYAAARAASGDSKGAVRSAKIAETLDPATMAVRSDRCWYLIFDQRFDTAAEVCSSAYQLSPYDIAARVGSAEAHVQLGNMDRALDIMLEAIRFIDAAAFDNFTSPPETWQQLGCVRVRDILSRDNFLGVGHYQLAKYQMQCGAPDEALRELQKSFENREHAALFFRYSPEFSALRERPEMAQLEALLP